MKTPKKRKAVLGHPVTIPAAILHILADIGEAYGFMLSEEITKRTDGKLTALWGSVYPALYHLQEDGLIEAVAVDASAKGAERSRKVYKITERGRQRASENSEIVASMFR